MIPGMVLVSAMHEHLCRHSLHNLLHLMWVHLLSSERIVTYIPFARIHFVRNLLRKRFYKCCAPFCQRRLHWYVSIVLSILIVEDFSDPVVQ